MKTFLFLTDLHYGFERKSGHKTTLHDPKAMNVALQFANHFKPDVLILGGDILDCGCISHHNHGKPGRTESMRLMDDAAGCRSEFIEKLPAAATKVFINGNHEHWLQDFEETYPAVQGMFSADKLLGLDSSWLVVPQGGHYCLDKLTFIHGDTLSSGEHAAKNATINYESSVRFGHFHTFQAYTKNTPIDNKLGKLSMAVPCLCRKDPHYGKGKPNRWVQGLNYGVVYPDKSYHDHVALITNGKMYADGKIYQG